MANFESDAVVLNANCDEVFDFLADFRNMKSFMPPQVQAWEADKDNCSFEISGLGRFQMRMAAQSPGRNLHIVSEGKNPVEYSLDYFLREKDDQRCELRVLFEAGLNPMMKMVAGNALQNLVDIMAGRIRDHFSGD